MSESGDMNLLESGKMEFYDARLVRMAIVAIVRMMVIRQIYTLTDGEGIIDPLDKRFLSHKDLRRFRNIEPIQKMLLQNIDGYASGILEYPGYRISQDYTEIEADTIDAIVETWERQLGWKKRGKINIQTYLASIFGMINYILNDNQNPITNAFVKRRFERLFRDLTALYEYYVELEKREYALCGIAGDIAFDKFSDVVGFER